MRAPGDCHLWEPADTPKGQIVFDVLMLILLGVAFAGAVGYVWVCNDLTGPGNPAGDKSP